MNHLPRRAHPGGFNILAVLVIAAIAAGCGQQSSSPAKPAAKKRKPPLVETAPVTVGAIANELELTGEVVATRTVLIAATKEGPISFCPWREGDTVKQGEKLVAIDRAVHRAETASAEAALAVAQARLADLKAGARSEEIGQAKSAVDKWQASLEQARKDLERQETLIKQEYTSQQMVDQARERVNVAAAELASARQKLKLLQAGPAASDVAVQEAVVKEANARLDLARAHLDECVIDAPFAGRITAVHVRPGDLAAPRAALIEMFDPDSLVLRFSVPEAHAAAVRAGMKLTAGLDAWRGRQVEGEITRVYPILDAQLRTRTVEAQLESDEPLLPNQFARVTLVLERRPQAVLIPAAARLLTPRGQEVVFIVKDGKAVQRQIESGIEAGGRIQVVRGLQPGQKVVVTGNEKLKPDMPVRVAGAGKKKTADAARRGAPDAKATPAGARKPKTQGAPDKTPAAGGGKRP